MTDPGAAGAAPMDAAEIRRRATVGALLLTARGLAIRLVALAANLVLARLLVPRDFGLVAIGSSLVTFGDFLASSGVAAALIRRPEAPDRADLAAVTGLQLGVTVPLAAVTAAVGVLLGTGGTVAAVMVASLPVLALRTPGVVTLERELSYRLLALVEVLDALVYAGWAVVTVLLGWGVWGLATAAPARAVVGTLVLLAGGRPGPLRPRLDVARLRPILGFGARFQAIALLGLVRDQGLNLATAAVAGTTVLGLWTLVYRVLQTLLLVLDGLWRVSYPAMAQLRGTGEDPRPIIERGVGIVAVASGLFLVLAVGTGPSIIPLALGDRWRDAAEILPGTCLGLMIVGPVSVAVAGYLFAEGDAGTVLRSAALHTGAQFALVLPLLPVLGPWALGLGGLAACVVEAIVLGRAAHRRSGARILGPLVVPVAGLAVGGSLGWATSTGRPASVLVVLAAAGSALGGYLGPILILRPALLADVLRLLRRLRAR